MAIPEPGCNDGPNQLLSKILLGLVDVQVSIAAAVAGSAKGGQEPIGAGATTVAVVFATPFTAVPSIVASISRPLAGSLIYVDVDSDSVTVNGFTATLSAATPDATFILNWIGSIP